MWQVGVVFPFFYWNIQQKTKIDCIKSKTQQIRLNFESNFLLLKYIFLATQLPGCRTNLDSIDLLWNIENFDKFTCRWRWVFCKCVGNLKLFSTYIFGIQSYIAQAICNNKNWFKSISKEMLCILIFSNSAWIIWLFEKKYPRIIFFI